MNNEKSNQQELQTQSSNQQSVENAAETKAPKKSKKKGLLIGIIAAVLVVILAVGAFLCVHFGLFNGKGEAVPAGERPLTNEELKALPYNEVTQLEFYPNAIFTEDDLKAATAIMEERVKLLGSSYEISYDSEKITLFIEKALLGNTAFERAQMVELIKSRGNFDIGDDYGSYGESMDKAIIDKLSVKSVAREDVLSDFKLDLDEERYEQLENNQADTLYIVEGTVKSSYQTEFSEEVEYVTDYYKASMYHDIAPEGGSYGCEFLGSLLFPGDDYNTFYIVSNASSFEKNADVIKSVLEGDTFELGFVTKIADEPTWETETKDFGANQVTEMTGNAIVVECTPDEYTIEYGTTVDFEEHKAVIKARLDILGVDYMFGTKGFDDKTLCIKVTPTVLGPDFIRFLFSSRSVNVNSAFDTVPVFYSPEITGDLQYGIKMTSYYTSDEIMSQYNIPDNMVYLVVNNVTIASADITSMNNEEKSIVFDKFLCFDFETATESDKVMLELICSIYNESTYTSFSSDSIDIRSYDGDTEIKDFRLEDLSWEYSSFTTVDLETFDKVSSMGHGITKSVEARNKIIITMDMPVDENLPTNFLNEVKAVYDACNFDDGSYNEIHFVIKDEKAESPANDFRIEFKKDTYDGKMIANDYINGPKFNDYWSDVFEIMEADEFFTSKSW